MKLNTVNILNLKRDGLFAVRDLKAKSSVGVAQIISMSTVTMAMDYLHTRAPPYITITITITIIIGLLSTRIHCVTDNDGYTDCSSRRFKLLEGAGHCGYFSVVPLEGAGGAAVGVEEGDSVLAACLQGCVQDEGCGMIALQYPQLSNYDDEDDDYVCYGSNGSGRLVVKSSTNIKMYRNYGVGGNNTNVATTAAACPSPFGALSDPCLQGGCYYVPDDVAGNRTSLTSAEVTCQSLDTRAHVIHTETEQVRSGSCNQGRGTKARVM